MTETLPPCPREDCDADPAWAGHHDHKLNGLGKGRARPIGEDHEQPGVTPMCDVPTSRFSRCYSAHIPTEPAASLEGAPDAPSPVTYRDAETGQYVTAEHAATNPATTVREDDSRVRELGGRIAALILLHTPITVDGVDYCAECNVESSSWMVEHPCRTRRIAEGEAGVES